MRIFTQETSSVKVGERFNRLTVMGPEFFIPVPNAAKASGWQAQKYVVVRCDCGAWCCERVGNLKQAATTSCGCLRSQKLIALKTTHGSCRHPLYQVWSSMLKRCENPKCKSHANYGGRGIRVCQEWHKFKPFFDWCLTSGWHNGLELDRRNNDGNYEPENCRFVTTAVNQRNKRDNHRVAAFGEIKILVEWSEDSRCKVSYTTILRRLRAGWNPEKAMTVPIKTTGRVYKKKVAS